SEQRVQHLARETGIHTVVICSAIVLGANDYRVTPSNQLVMDWLNGIGQTYRGGLNLVVVRVVVADHVAGLTKGENLRPYLVGGQNILVKDIGQLLKKMTGIRPIHVPFPRGIMLVTARLLEGVCKRIKVKPPFTYDLLYEVSDRYAWYDCQDTYNTFGLKPY